MITVTTAAAIKEHIQVLLFADKCAVFLIINLRPTSIITLMNS